MCAELLQCTSHEFPSDFPFIEYFLDLVDKINSLRIKKKSGIKIRNKNWCKRLYASLVFIVSHPIGKKHRSRKKKKEFE